jgi:autotransporter translocation and assembly factor TamB
MASAGAKVQNLQSHLTFRLAGFDIVSGSISVNVNSLPLVVDGITRANADVDIAKLTITRDADRILVDVPFQKLIARLPGASPRELTSLDENENVTMLQPVSEPKAARSGSSLPWQFAIHLGDNAKIQRGQQLNLPITGDPNVVLASGLGVTGSVMLQRHGNVNLFGQTFIIEGGAIVFDTPDPADPRLDVRASWHSATSETLFMYVSGTLSKPKVQFDRPPDQALALLRGGSDTGTTDIGFSVLDTLLADTPLARVQLRGQDSQDTTHGATYTAAYRASDRITVEGNYQAPGATESSDQIATVGAAVDWRLTKTISLRGQLGTIGTGVDLIYQYRY